MLQRREIISLCLFPTLRLSLKYLFCACSLHVINLGILSKNSAKPMFKHFAGITVSAKAHVLFILYQRKVSIMQKTAYSARGSLFTPN